MKTNLYDKEKTEIEAKFNCPDGLSLDNLLIAASTFGFRYIKVAPCFQTDIYWDTPDYLLLKSDAALRIRQSGENYVGTYKASKKQQQNVIFERREFEWKLSSDETKLYEEGKKPPIPPTVIEMLNLQGKTLRKVLVVETYRYTAVINDTGELKAEVALDEVTFRGHKGQKPYREIEIELLNGQFEHFKQTINSLQNHLKLQPAINSKYKQGLLLVGKHEIQTVSTAVK